MSDNKKDITGGDLEDLWEISHQFLPEVREVYAEQTQKLSEVSSVDGDKYGPAHPSWAYIAGQLQTAMAFHASAVDTACTAIDSAIDAYKYTDEKNSDELTKAGKALEEILEEQDKEDSVPDPTPVKYYFTSSPSDWD